MSLLTVEQRHALVQELERSRQALLDAGAGLSPAQWNWKAAPDRWSVAECLDHVAIVEQMLAGRMARIAAAAPDAEAGARVAGREELIVKGGRSRENKRTAPEMARPTARFASLAEFDAHFTPLRQANIDFVKTTQAPLHVLIEPHPALGDMSGHQWLWFLSAHCDRHTAQAREVRETEGFPAA
jgi:uncharacterized damage-inducible protein DinB